MSLPRLADPPVGSVYLPPMRVRTLHTSVLIAVGGTIRGGSFLSATIVAARLRRWHLTISSLPSGPIA